jgi:type IV pilus assembly protein PilA
MGSVTCERCGFVSFATSEVCKQCGGPLPGPQAAPDWQPQTRAGNRPPPHAHSAHYQPQPNYRAAADVLPKRRGMAAASMLCGLLALPVMLVGALAAIPFGAPAALLGVGAGLVMTILSLALGIAGTMQVNENPSEFGGKGMAVAGIILGSLLLVSVVPIGVIASIAVPNLLAARRAANEAAALNSLRTISTAEEGYQETVGGGEYGGLEDLSREGFIKGGMTAEVRSGYRYELSVSGDSYELTATPVDYPNSGARSFYLSDEGVIRGADKNGAPADADDPPVASTQQGSPATAGGEDVEWTEDGPAIRRTGSQPHGRR